MTQVKDIEVTHETSGSKVGFLGRGLGDSSSIAIAASLEFDPLYLMTITKPTQLVSTGPEQCIKACGADDCSAGDFRILLAAAMDVGAPFLLLVPRLTLFVSVLTSSFIQFEGPSLCF